MLKIKKNKKFLVSSYQTVFNELISITGFFMIKTNFFQHENKIEY